MQLRAIAAKGVDTVKDVLPLLATLEAIGEVPGACGS
jgi:hypothetical protein